MTQQSEQSNRYRIVSKLCSGGMADIFLAIQLDQQVLERFVVVKKIRNIADATPETKGMFADEARIVSTLSHPHVVQIFDFKERENYFHIIMEYIDGESLGFILNSHKRNNKRIPLPVGMRLMIQALEALEYIHGATSRTGEPLNIVHRDLDPRNLMLDSNGYLKIIDFGVAKAAVQTELTCPGLFKGKLSHVAPEMFTQSDIDSRADIYSIGLVLFEIVTGERPYRFGKSPVLADTIKTIVGDPIPTPSSINPDIPEALDKIILKACSKNREDRYQSADELHIALIQFAHGNEKGCGVASNGEVKTWFNTSFKERLTKRRSFEYSLLQKTKQAMDGRPSKFSGTMPPLLDSEKSGMSSVASSVSITGSQISGYDSASSMPLADGVTGISSVNGVKVKATPPPLPPNRPYSSNTLPPYSLAPPLHNDDVSTSDTFSGQSRRRFIKIALAAASVALLISTFLFLFWGDNLPWIESNSTKQLASVDNTVTLLDPITVDLNDSEEDQQPIRPESIPSADNTPKAVSAPEHTGHRKVYSKDINISPKAPSPSLNSKWRKYKTRALNREKHQEIAVTAELAKKAAAEEAELIERADSEMTSETNNPYGIQTAETDPHGAVNTAMRKQSISLAPPQQHSDTTLVPDSTKSQKQQLMSGSGDWNGQKVAQRGCGSCHSVDALSKTNSQWEYFFSHNRHRRNANLKGLFSSAELRRVKAYLISIVEKSKKNSSGIAGVR